MLMSEAKEKFERAKKGAITKATREWYEKRLGSMMSFLGDVEIEDVIPDDLHRWKESLIDRGSRWADHDKRPEEKGGLSNWTIRGYLRTVRVFFNFLVNERYLEHSPAKSLRLPRRPTNQPRYIKREDAVKMLKAAKKNPRDYAILLFLADTGCRVGSVVSLCFDKLDLNGQVDPHGNVFYVAEVETKGFGGVSREIVVYFGERTAEALRAYLQVRPQNGCNQVFIGLRGALKESGIYQILKRLAKKTGVKKNWNPHAFRHAWAYGARMRGGDIADVSESLGHSDIAVTHKFYGQLPSPETAKRHLYLSWVNSLGDDELEDDTSSAEEK